MSLTRKQFLQSLLLAGCGIALPGGLRAQERERGREREHFDFYFTRLMYESGDWDVDQRMPSNLLNSLVEYTNLKVDPEERIVPLADAEMLLAPFCYLAGHKLVEFTEAEARNFRDYINRGGFVFVDDCNHDIDGLFAKSFEAQMVKLFGEQCLQKLADNHDLYRCFFQFDDLPVTSFELNGWGDDLVHDYLKAIVVDGRIALLYSNKDFGCEWDYDYRNKRWLATDNTKFAVNIVIYALTS